MLQLCSWQATQKARAPISSDVNALMGGVDVGRYAYDTMGQPLGKPLPIIPDGVPSHNQWAANRAKD